MRIERDAILSSRVRFARSSLGESFSSDSGRVVGRSAFARRTNHAERNETNGEDREFACDDAQWFLAGTSTFCGFAWHSISSFDLKCLKAKLSLSDQSSVCVFRTRCGQKYVDRLTICGCSPMARLVLVGLGLVLGYDDSRVPRFKHWNLCTFENVRRSSLLMSLTGYLERKCDAKSEFAFDTI